MQERSRVDYLQDNLNTGLSSIMVSESIRRWMRWGDAAVLCWKDEEMDGKGVLAGQGEG